MDEADSINTLLGDDEIILIFSILPDASIRLASMCCRRYFVDKVAE